MKKWHYVLIWLLMIISYSLLHSSMKANALIGIIIGSCLAVLEMIAFTVLELRSKYSKRQTLYKCISIVSFLAGNAFYCFAVCFSAWFQQYGILYCAITVVLMLPSMILLQIKNKA